MKTIWQGIKSVCFGIAQGFLWFVLVPIVNWFKKDITGNVKGEMAMWLPFPSDFPSGEGVQIILDMWNNRSVDLKKGNHAAWHLWGFVSGKYFPDSPLAQTATFHMPAKVWTDSEIHAALEAANHSDDSKLKALSFDWKALLWDVVRTIIQKVITGDLLPI